MNKAQRRLAEALVLLVVLVVISSTFFAALYRVSAVKAFYMAIMVMTTVGADAPAPHTTAQFLLAAFAALGGVSVGLYTVGTLTGYLVGGDLQAAWGRRRMERRVRRMQGHIVIAGGGRVGQRAAEEVAGLGRVGAVIIESDPQRCVELAQRGFQVIEGDAAEQGTLQAAAVPEAYGLIAALPSDAENLYVVLAARELNPGLVITARAENAASERRLLLAGASRVVVPTRIGGRRLARLTLQPSSAELIDSSWLWEHGFDLVDLAVAAQSPVRGMSLRDLRRDNGPSIVVVAVEHSGMLNVPPDPDRPLAEGDHLFVSGTRDELERLRRLVDSAAGEAEASAT